MGRTRMINDPRVETPRHIDTDDMQLQEPHLPHPSITIKPCLVITRDSHSGVAVVAVHVQERWSIDECFYAAV